MKNTKILNNSNSVVTCSGEIRADGSTLELRRGELILGHKTVELVHEISFTNNKDSLLATISVPKDNWFIVRSLWSLFDKAYPFFTVDTVVKKLECCQEEIQDNLIELPKQTQVSLNNINERYGAVSCGIAFLFYVQGIDIDTRTTGDIVQFYAETIESKSLKSLEILEEIFDRERLLALWNKYETLEIILLKVKRKVIQNENFKQYFHHAYSAFASEDSNIESTLVKNLSLVTFDDNEPVDINITKKIFEYPVDFLGYRNYLMNLPVLSFKTLCSRFHKSISLKDALYVSEKIVSETVKSTLNVNGDKLADEIITSIRAKTKFPRKMAWGVDAIRKGIDNVNTLLFIKDLLDESDPDEIIEFSTSFLFGVEMVLLPARIHRWLEGDADPDLVVGILREYGSANQILKVLQDVQDSDELPNFSQWINFSKNFEDFHTIPVSWWMNL